MPQLSLKFADHRTIDERFAEFLRVNPHVYVAFAAAARELKAKGHRRWSARGIFEKLRYEQGIRTVHIGEWALNNDFTSRMARKLIAEDRSFADFFELRKIRSE